MKIYIAKDKNLNSVEDEKWENVKDFVCSKMLAEIKELWYQEMMKKEDKRLLLGRFYFDKPIPIYA